jgi:hypothetical protein
MRAAGAQQGSASLCCPHAMRCACIVQRLWLTRTAAKGGAAVRTGVLWDWTIMQGLLVLQCAGAVQCVRTGVQGLCT